jgi:hypothetical protein
MQTLPEQRSGETWSSREQFARPTGTADAHAREQFVARRLGLAGMREAVCWGLIGLWLSPFLLGAAGPAERPERRVTPPDWKDVPPGIFFEDAFAEGLVGTPRTSPSADASVSNTDGASPDGTAAIRDTSADWQEVISAETIEDEIKSILMRVSALVRNASDFKSRGYRQVRREFSIAAMLFAIIHEYPAPVRWQQHAAQARDAFAQAAIRAQVGSDTVLQQAEQLRTSLEDLVRGGSFALQPAASPAGWDHVCARSPLMQHLEVIDADQLATSLASTSSFRQDRSRIAHESELVAAIAVVLLQSGMEDATDDDYREYCDAMRQAARAIGKAVDDDDYEAARQAQVQLKRSCTDCHADYRG